MNCESFFSSKDVHSLTRHQAQIVTVINRLSATASIHFQRDRKTLSKLKFKGKNEIVLWMIQIELKENIENDNSNKKIKFDQWGKKLVVFKYNRIF